MIEDKIVRVHRNDAMSELKLRLNGYRRSWNRVYIGVTTDPERRWAKHCLNGYTKMVLLYEAYNEDIAIELERDLIDYSRHCNFILPIVNINPGGEGVKAHRNHHYLYIIVGN